MTTTGPRTPAGKAAVALNSIRHGLRCVAIAIPGVESDDEWQTFRDAIFDDYEPVGPVEEALAQRAAEALWRLRRINRAESQAVVDRAAGRERKKKSREDLHASGVLPEIYKDAFRPETLPGFVPIPDDGDIATLIRYEAHLARQFYQAEHELEARRNRREGHPSPLARLDLNTGPSEP